MANLALGYAFNLSDLFVKFDKSKLKMTSEICKKQNNDEHKTNMIHKVFMESVYQILDDIIENNDTFQLPVYQRKSFLKMKRIDGDDFIKARQNGKYQDIDFLETNFSSYDLKLQMQHPNRPTREKNIYLGGELKRKLIQNINDGKQYY